MQHCSRTKPHAKSTSQDMHEDETDSQYNENVDSTDAVALAQALPPRISPQLQSTPPARLRLTGPHDHASTSSPLASSAIDSVVDATSSARDVTTNTTPRISVYDDKKSPRTQPRTTADITTTARRHHGRSTTTTAMHYTRSAMYSSPTQPTSGRTSDHATHRTNMSHSPSNGIMAPEISSELSGAARRDSAIDIGTGENDIENSLHGLEQDRRTWVSRREEGSLEVTPPREGRFERFLS